MFEVTPGIDDDHEPTQGKEALKSKGQFGPLDAAEMASTSSSSII
jgi:hypothetical protein